MSMQNGNGKLKYVIDIDGTICTQHGLDYHTAVPKTAVISKINKLYEEGNEITLFTARGYETGIDWSMLTLRQLESWHVKYHNLYFGKPSADFYIDDKACHVDDFIVEDNLEFITSVDKCWGKEYLLDINKYYAMKRLVIDAGKNISLQYHKKKHETWHVVKGTGVVRLNDELFEVCTGSTVTIPAGSIHQVKATTDLVIIESSTTELDDIIRIREDFKYDVHWRNRD